MRNAPAKKDFFTVISMPADKESIASMRSSSVSGVPSKKMRLASAVTQSEMSSIVNLPPISSEKKTRKRSNDSPGQ